MIKTIYIISLYNIYKANYKTKSKAAAMLHIINSFPIDCSRLEQTSYGDTVLLTDNAVYAVKKTDKSDKIFKKVSRHLNFCVLGSDLLSRGVSTSEIFRSVCVIEDCDLTAITEEKTVVRSSN